jgi:uncharacterized protein (TIGR02246 family)
MKRVLLKCAVLISCGFVAGLTYADQANDEAAIRKSDDAYVQAFNKKDAKALAELWSPDAVYLNRMTGEEVTGRAPIGEQFAELFKAQPELKLEVSTESIQFVSPNVAVEHGTAKFTAPKGEPEDVAYQAVFVKRDGQWLLDRVTDDQKQAPPSHYEQLKPLEWMVGHWTDEGDKGLVELDCNWTKNQNFLTRAIKVSLGEGLEFTGMQIIGWDPAEKTIRSWTFDSNGTFAEATWSQKDKQWFIHNKGVLADGGKATMVNVMKQVDDNSFTWQTIERTVDGEIQPNIDEMLIVREEQ